MERRLQTSRRSVRHLYVSIGGLSVHMLTAQWTTNSLSVSKPVRGVDHRSSQVSALLKMTFLKLFVLTAGQELIRHACFVSFVSYPQRRPCCESILGHSKDNFDFPSGVTNLKNVFRFKSFDMAHLSQQTQRQQQTEKAVWCLPLCVKLKHCFMTARVVHNSSVMAEGENVLLKCRYYYMIFWLRRFWLSAGFQPSLGYVTCCVGAGLCFILGPSLSRDDYRGAADLSEHCLQRRGGGV